LIKTPYLPYANGFRKMAKQTCGSTTEALQKNNILNSLPAAINENKRYRAGIGEQIVHGCL